MYGVLHSFLHENKDVLGDLSQYQYVLQHLQQLFLPTVSGFICYDDGCHLWKFVWNSNRQHYTETAERIYNMEIVVDKMGFKGKWCKKFCNPNKFSDLDRVSWKLVTSKIKFLVSATMVRALAFALQQLFFLN